jgi:hypothetical protein
MKPRIDPLIVGVNPFVGVDHYLSERARQRRVELDARRIQRVLRKAFESGASGLTFSWGPEVAQMLSGLNGAAGPTELGLYPLVPSLGEYWPAFMSGGASGLISALLENLSVRSKARALWQGGLTWLTLDPERAVRAFVPIELEKLGAAIPATSKIRAVFLNETFTDLALAFRLDELMRTYAEVIEADLGFVPGFQTRNFPRLVEFMKASKMPVDRYTFMAPFNPIGFQMTLGRRASEEALAGLTNPSVIAISILAGGQVSLADSLKYLRSVPQIRSVAVGVSSEPHAEETFTHLRTLVAGR